MAKRSVAWPSGALLALSLVLAGWAAPHGTKDWPAPDEAKKLKNPAPATDASLAAAKTIYVDKCAQCHGEEGKGDGPEAPMYDVKPADFTDAHILGEMTDGEIFWKIGEGRRPMPSFRKQLTEEQRWQLVNYLRTLAPKPAPPTKASNTPANKKSPPPKP